MMRHLILHSVFHSLHATSYTNGNECVRESKICIFRKIPIKCIFRGFHLYQTTHAEEEEKKIVIRFKRSEKMRFLLTTGDCELLCFLNRTCI